MKFINFRKNINIYSEFEFKKFKKAIYSKNGTLDEWYRSVDEKVDNLLKIGKFRQYYILVTALAGKDDNWNDEIEFGNVFKAIIAGFVTIMVGFLSGYISIKSSNNQLLQNLYISKIDNKLSQEVVNVLAQSIQEEADYFGNTCMTILGCVIFGLLISGLIEYIGSKKNKKCSANHYLFYNELCKIFECKRQ